MNNLSQEQIEEWSRIRDEYFEERIQNVSKRAYEYGILVVKNAFLVSGGALFITPALIQAVKNPDVGRAANAGILFAICLLLVLVANYVIHINWMLHERIWELHRERDPIFIREMTNATTESDNTDLSHLNAAISKVNKWINWTFYFPHVSGFTFVVLFGWGCVELYSAMGVANSAMGITN